MVGDLRAGYPDKLPAAQAEELARANGPGLAALRAYLASGQAVAFLGAGVSALLCPLWDGLIGELAVLRTVLRVRTTRELWTPGCDADEGDD